MKILERRQLRSAVFIVNFENISCQFLVLPLLTLDKKLQLGHIRFSISGL